MKLLKPSTRIHAPVNWTTPARSESNASMRFPNVGASARGLKPWVKDTAVDIDIAANFHFLLQF